MASVNKIAEMLGKGAGKAKAAATKMAGTATKAATGAASKAKMKKQDIAASVRGATSKVAKPKAKPFAGLPGDKTGKGLKVATGATGVAAAGSVGYSAMKGNGDRQARETGTPNVEKKVASASKPTPTSKAMKPGSKPATKGAGTGRSPDRMDVAKPKGSVYRAQKGDGLWQVAEKTVPKGQSVSAWWAQIKKLNSTNGKVNKTVRNSAIKLPPGAQPKDKGFEFPKKNKNSSKNTMNVQ